MLNIDVSEYLEKVVTGMEVIKDFYTAMDSIDEYEKPLYSEEDLTIIRMNHGGVNDLIIKYLKENGKDYKEGHDYVLECFDILTMIKQYQKDTFDRLSEKLKEDEGIGGFRMSGFYRCRHVHKAKYGESGNQSFIADCT